MISRKEAQRQVDSDIEKVYQIANDDGEDYSATEAMCYGLSSLIMAQAFHEANAKSDSYDEKTLEVLGIAIAAQCATLNGFIEAGELDQNFVYESYINLVQEWN